MSKVKELNGKKRKKAEVVIAPNYDKFFENVVMDCSRIIVDAMKSSEKGDDLLFSCDVGTKEETHTISIQISKKVK